MLTPIVPTHSVAGRALLGVIAIMSFLASLTLGAVVLVRTSAGDWQSQVSREVTIQVRPVDGRDIETEVNRAALIARASHGIAQVKPYTKEESLRLLEPWLGSGLAVDELPVPRLIVVTIGPGARPHLEELRKALSEQVAGASLDDHRGWVERMRAMTRTAVAVGFAVLGLVLFATVLLIAFATRGAVATNRGIVEVLHFVGAKNRFIAGQFQRHFLELGLKGAVLGGGAAIAVFLLADFAAGPPADTAGAQEMAALFGGLMLPPEGYAGIVGVIVLIAAVTALASRWTVHRTLDSLD
ncbi:MAG: ABC transporter permease [Variibacter sp.]|nr:ABC transporter permease [Variibacter sp.]